MEFELTGDLADLRDLAERIFTDRGTPAAVAAIEREGGYDAVLWQSLADSDLIGVALPEDAGGAGLGLLGLVAILEQQGRRVSPVPLWSVVTQAAWPIAEAGTPAQRARWLPGIVDGSSIVTGTCELDLAGLPLLVTDPDGRVRGAVPAVPGAPLADAFVLPVLDGGRVRVAIIPADREGVRVEAVAVTDRGSSGTVTTDAVALDEDDYLPGDGSATVSTACARGRIALAALASGVTHEAVAITAAYTSQRIQFDRPLSTNQAVSQRAVDAYLDAERIRLTTYRAAWQHDTAGAAACGPDALVAKWWADTGGFRAVSATQHLHGGIGADVDYPIHRYYLWGRQICFTLGSAGAIEAELGDLLDTVSPIGASA